MIYICLAGVYIYIYGLCVTSPIITHIFWLNPDVCSGRWPANLYASWSEGYRLYMGHSGIHLHWILCNIHIIHHIRYLWTFTKHRKNMGYDGICTPWYGDLTDLTNVVTLMKPGIMLLVGGLSIYLLLIFMKRKLGLMMMMIPMILLSRMPWEFSATEMVVLTWLFYHEKGGAQGAQYPYILSVALSLSTISLIARLKDGSHKAGTDPEYDSAFGDPPCEICEIDVATRQLAIDESLKGLNSRTNEGAMEVDMYQLLLFDQWCSASSSLDTANLPLHGRLDQSFHGQKVSCQSPSTRELEW